MIEALGRSLVVDKLSTSGALWVDMVAVPGSTAAETIAAILLMKWPSA